MSNCLKNTLRMLVLTSLFPVAAYAASVPISFSRDCPYGGTRAESGTWDSSSGATNLTVTLTACNIDDHTVHDGTVNITGTFSYTDSTKTSVSQNLTFTVNTKITGDNTYTRSCTLTRVGTFSSTTKTFSGTITRNNCTISGDFTERGGSYNGLMKDILKAER